jgi:hypothetical protein
MRKVIVILLFAVFAVVGLASHNAVANGQEKEAAGPKQGRWHGMIVRMDKEASTLDVRKDNTVKRIYYDSSTKWTEGTKIIEMSEFKENMDVICLGTYDEKGHLHATRIQLQRR